MKFQLKRLENALQLLVHSATVNKI